MQSCQSLAGPAKQHVPVRGEAGANGRGVVVGPADLPPLSRRPPQQIERPAGRHGARHGPMLGAHMPQSTNSHLHTNMHIYTNMCMYKTHACLDNDTTTLSLRNYASIQLNCNSRRAVKETKLAPGYIFHHSNKK